MDMYGSSYQPNPNQPYRSRRSARMEAASLILGSIALPVSYTHLTLPTNSRV